MKNYTDIQQSKKLAEILPIESADMFFADLLVDGSHKYIIHPLESYGFNTFKDTEAHKSKRLNFIPCWSLSALLDILESELDGENGTTYQLHLYKDGTWWDISYDEVYDETSPIEVAAGEELVDVCVEMILKLNELKML